MKHLLLILIITVGQAQAQYTPILSQYMFNGVALNPALTGSEESFSIIGSVRGQWVGFDGAPRTQVLTAHAPLLNKNSAFGAQLFSDQIGITRNTGIYGMYSYKIMLDKSKISLGISGGLNFIKSYYSRLEVVDQNDQEIMNDSRLGVLPDFSFGAHYSATKYFISFSIPLFLTHLNEGATFKLKNDFSNYTYMIGGGYLFKINDQVKLKPSLLGKFRQKNEPQFDFNLMALLNENLEFGVSYRTKEAVIAMAAIKPTKQLTIMYSLGIPTTKIINYSFGSHELSLRYNFLYQSPIVGPRTLTW